MTLNLLILSAPYLLLKPLTLSGHHSLFFPDLVLLLPDLPNLGFQTGNEGLLVPQVVSHLVVLPPGCLKYVAQTVGYPLTMLRQLLVEIAEDSFHIEG